MGPSARAFPPPTRPGGVQPVSLERRNKSERATKTGDPREAATGGARRVRAREPHGVCVCIIYTRTPPGRRGTLGWRDGGGGGGAFFERSRGPSHMARPCVRASDDPIVPSLSRHIIIFYNITACTPENVYI